MRRFGCYLSGVRIRSLKSENPKNPGDVRSWGKLMKYQNIRFMSAELWNFKNVAHGKIEMPLALRRDFSCEKSEILGIYGQNGSGKTTVIDALFFAKQLLQGRPLPSYAADYIAKNAEEAVCSLAFYLEKEQGGVVVSYEFTMRRAENGAYISHEKLAARTLTEEGLSPAKTLLAYDAMGSGRFLSPKYRWDALISASPDAAIDLAVARRLSVGNGTSFLFSSDFGAVLAFSPDEEMEGKAGLFDVRSALSRYAAEGLFVVSCDHSGVIALSAVLPIALHFDGDEKTPDEMLLSLTEPSVQPLDTYRIVKTSVAALNCVLGVLIPGMSLEIREYGGQMTPDGKDGMRFEILSVREENRIPLKYESEGIKKLISILSILIAMYNNASVFVAVDEFDAGVYEYLLGEILGILEESGRGQLLFTSHNLRPLEMIDRQDIVFTTTNPDNRYIRASGARGNLRDRYIRSISLGGQKEELYDYRNPMEIARAFRLASRCGDESR